MIAGQIGGRQSKDEGTLDRGSCVKQGVQKGVPYFADLYVKGSSPLGEYVGLVERDRPQHALARTTKEDVTQVRGLHCDLR